MSITGVDFLDELIERIYSMGDAAENFRSELDDWGRLPPRTFLSSWPPFDGADL